MWGLFPVDSAAWNAGVGMLGSVSWGRVAAALRLQKSSEEQVEMYWAGGHSGDLGLSSREEKHLSLECCSRGQNWAGDRSTVLNLENFENNPRCPAMSQSTCAGTRPGLRGHRVSWGSALDRLRELSASNTSELSAQSQTWDRTC